MIAYYKLVTNQYEGGTKEGERQLAAVSDLVIRDDGKLVKDRQGYVTKAIKEPQEAPEPERFTLWNDPDTQGFPQLYLGHWRFFDTARRTTRDFSDQPHIVAKWTPYNG